MLPIRIFKSLLIAASLLITNASITTQYVCNNGEYCQVTSTGSVCTATAEMPGGTITWINPNNRKIRTQCFGLPDRVLVSSGGSCILTCPSSCIVTKDVKIPCEGYGNDANDVVEDDFVNDDDDIDWIDHSKHSQHSGDDDDGIDDDDDRASASAHLRPALYLVISYSVFQFI